MQKLCTWAGVAAFALLGANVSNASTASFIFDNENNNRLWFTGGDGDTRVYTSVLFCSEGLSLGFGQDESSVSIAERVSCGGVMTTQFLLPWVSPENALAATAGFYDGDGEDAPLLASWNGDFEFAMRISADGQNASFFAPLDPLNEFQEEALAWLEFSFSPFDCAGFECSKFQNPSPPPGNGAAVIPLPAAGWLLLGGLGLLGGASKLRRRAS